MKKRLILGLLALLLLAGGFTGYKVFGPAVSITKGRLLYIWEGDDFETVTRRLTDSGFISKGAWFSRVAGWRNYSKIKPGRYELTSGMSLFDLAGLLRSGKQSPVKMTIVKERTREGLAAKMGRKFDTLVDSLQLISFLSNNDSLRPFDTDTNTVMTQVMPYTYEINWNSTPGKIMQQFHTAWKKFWTPERKQKADSLHLSPTEVSILASIVEEETLRKDDKYKIASVYLNRLRLDMKLEADPTAKFVTRNFKLGRIMHSHLKLESPYNTYLHKGLPPGPICTPSVESIEAVLDAPKTDYIFFVASYQFDGSTIFTSNYADHSKYVRMFHAEQNRRADSIKKRQAR